MTWEDILNQEREKEYYKNLRTFVGTEYKQYTCYPPKKNIMEAFTLTPFQDVKVVIIGQDPYHGAHQAHGLCFSVKEGTPFPPSLVNIFKEINTDLNIPVPQSGDLTRWATQGVFLLNATLTVREHQAGSHQNKGWEIFTDTVIQNISAHKENVIFLLWGGFAKKKAQLIDAKKHHILTSGHPSPLSANRGYWFGNRHFSKTNEILKNKGETPIIW